MIYDWYPFNVVAYRRDTMHLTPEQDSAYRRLIDAYMYDFRGPLPNNDDVLARLAGIPKADWDRLATVVRRFFRMRNDKLWLKRCELELRAQNARHNRYRERASKGGKAKAFKDKHLRALSELVSATRQDIYKTLPPEKVPREEAVRKDVASAELRSIEGGKRR